MPPSKNISFEELSKYFHLPINQVAKEMGVCATILKKICRRNGIPRWPHRKIKSLDKMIANLNMNLAKNPQEREEIAREIALLEMKKIEIMKNPNILVKGSAFTGFKSLNYNMKSKHSKSKKLPQMKEETPPQDADIAFLLSSMKGKDVTNTSSGSSSESDGEDDEDYQESINDEDRKTIRTSNTTTKSSNPHTRTPPKNAFQHQENGSSTIRYAFGPPSIHPTTTTDNQSTLHTNTYNTKTKLHTTTTTTTTPTIPPLISTTFPYHNNHYHPNDNVIPSSSTTTTTTTTTLPFPPLSPSSSPHLLTHPPPPPHPQQLLPRHSPQLGIRSLTTDHSPFHQQPPPSYRSWSIPQYEHSLVPMVGFPPHNPNNNNNNNNGNRMLSPPEFPMIGLPSLHNSPAVLLPPPNLSIPMMNNGTGPSLPSWFEEERKRRLGITQ